MKSFISVLAVIAILIMPYKASACLILGDLNSLGNTSFSFSPTGEFDDDMKFTLAEDSFVGISVTNVYTTFPSFTSNEIKSFAGSLAGPDSATLDLSTISLAGQPSPFVSTVQTLTFGGLLSAGEYMFNITGNAPTGASYGGNLFAVAQSVTAVPIPAALWLFGSAMFGMVGFKRSRNTTTA